MKNVVIITSLFVVSTLPLPTSTFAESLALGEIQVQTEQRTINNSDLTARLQEIILKLENIIERLKNILNDLERLDN